MKTTYPIYADLWTGNPGGGENAALRCGDCVLSFSMLFQEIRRAEAGLRALQVQPGELVTVISLGTPEAVAALYAIDRIGAVSNWVDMKLNPSEVETYLAQAGSRVVLVLELAFAKVYENRRSAPAQHFVVLPIAPYLPPALGKKLGTGTWPAHGGGDCLSWAQFLREPREALPEGDRWEEPAVITYTGGTTGPAKGVMLSRRAFHASLLQYTQAKTEYGRGGAALTLLPPFAAFGLCQCIHVPLCLGMTVILAPLFRPGDLGALLVRYRPEQVNGTTSYWQLLLRSSRGEQADLSFLKVPRNGGDAMAAEMEQRINAFLHAHKSPGRLVKEYGMSEVCGITCLNYGGVPVPGNVGYPLPGSQIAVVDPDTGEPLPPGERGEILIRSDTVMNGYFCHPEADQEVLRPGPEGKCWVWTKDWGFQEADGSLVIVGRKKRMISRNGFKIFPSVIENCLLQSPLVEACAVVGGETSAGETLPVAFVVLKQPETDHRQAETALRLLCLRALNDYLIPAAYHFLAALPLTERAKLDYRSLEQSAGRGIPKTAGK